MPGLLGQVMGCLWWVFWRKLTTCDGMPLHLEFRWNVICVWWPYPVRVRKLKVYYGNIDHFHSSEWVVLDGYRSLRLLHSPSLVAGGLTVRYKTWPPIHFLWLVGLNTCWDCLSIIHCGLVWLVWVSTIFKRPLTVPFQGPDGRQMPTIRAVQGDWKSLQIPPDLGPEWGWDYFH